jgi:hypothetical protein
MGRTVLLHFIVSTTAKKLSIYNNVYITLFAILNLSEAISNIASFEGSGYKRLVDVEFWPGRYCYHTSYGEKPFWQVDLGDIFIIYLIRIYQWGTLISE